MSPSPATPIGPFRAFQPTSFTLRPSKRPHRKILICNTEAMEGIEPSPAGRTGSAFFQLRRSPEAESIPKDPSLLTQRRGNGRRSQVIHTFHQLDRREDQISAKSAKQPRGKRTSQMRSTDEDDF